MNIYHNSHDINYRRPFGAAVADSAVTLFIKTEGIFTCNLLLWLGNGSMQRLPMKAVENGFEITIRMPEKPQLLWYCFQVDELYYGNKESRYGGEGQVYDHMPPCYQITVYNESKTPDWYKNAVVYQIFPDRFNRGSDWLQRQITAAECRGKNSIKRILHQNWDDSPFYPRDERNAISRWPFFGGTLEGIREKLDYLKELSITAIYLNPIFKASSNHKYDTCDYLTIDEGFGDEESFRKLAESASEMGISLILDGVFSHTGADSIYFDKFHNYGTGAAVSTDSPYYSWYRFYNYPDTYECWWGVDDLPNVEENDPSYREFICRGKDSVIRKWLKLGARGWRLDVADELPDSFIKDIRIAMEETKDDSVLLGEVWEDASNKISYGERREYLFGDELHSTMNYPFRAAAIDYVMGKMSPSDMGNMLMSMMENYPLENFYGALNLIGSHDRARTLTVLGGAPEHLSDLEKEKFRLSPGALALAIRRMKLISLLQFVTPGVPCVYYGDEAGCEGYEDPYNRGTYPWGNENKELLEHYKALGKLRTDFPALIAGDYEPLSYGHAVYGCIRSLENESVMALFNRDTEIGAVIPLPKGYDKIEFSICDAPAIKSGHITLPPLSGVLLSKRK